MCVCAGLAFAATAHHFDCQSHFSCCQDLWLPPSRRMWKPMPAAAAAQTPDTLLYSNSNNNNSNENNFNFKNNNCNNNNKLPFALKLNSALRCAGKTRCSRYD